MGFINGLKDQFRREFLGTPSFEEVARSVVGGTNMRLVGCKGDTAVAIVTLGRHQHEVYVSSTSGGQRVAVAVYSRFVFRRHIPRAVARLIDAADGRNGDVAFSSIRTREGHEVYGVAFGPMDQFCPAMLVDYVNEVGQYVTRLDTALEHSGELD